MSDPTLVIGVAILVVAFYFMAFVTYLSKKRPSPVINEAAQRPRPIPVLRGAGVEGPRRAGRNIRARMRAAASRNVDEELIYNYEEEEMALKEEQERKEYEEYLKLKESFAIEEEGFDQEENADEGNKFQEFIDYIKSQKVVLMEDLASRFKLKTQEAIDRVQELLAQEWLVGVIDDRGKFIYITKEELEAVAHFIRQRGRVSIAELVECSNSLINLTPDSPETVQVSS
ncbi:DDRGK domain-containing protein 1 [Argiope bruennichi]|uniref:DDRGK domain-containing protein 1 n=1 Tax=Argiope bruennichi TaxID=94029 RepID=A0A8T0E895_ARGBR|nr:DDRGK domain-containing protein 1 [Argiope bruennichi]